MSIDEISREEWDEFSRKYYSSGKALDKQVGGEHYKKCKKQPLEMCYELYGFEGIKHSIFVKVVKYLTRDKYDGEKRLEDYDKAIHCIEILKQYYKESK